MKLLRKKSIGLLSFILFTMTIAGQTCDDPVLVCFGNNTNLVQMNAGPSGIDASCFTADNSAYMEFSTNNVGGEVNVTVTQGTCIDSIGYDDELSVAVFSTNDLCNGPYATIVCNTAATGTMVLNAMGLLPNSTYYIQVDGDLNGIGITNAAECLFNVNITGAGVELPISLSQDQFIVNGGSVELIATGGTSYNWTPPIALSNTMIENPIASPIENTEYTVEIINGDCIVQRRVWVFVFEPITIYEAFTPNGDGINDDWVISRIDAFPQCSVQIFNRWGQLVHKSIGYTIPWDGKNNGSALPAGNYYYVVELNDDEVNTELFTGRVTIIY